MTHAGRHRVAGVGGGGWWNQTSLNITAALIQHERSFQEGRSEHRCWNMQRKKKEALSLFTPSCTMVCVNAALQMLPLV